jgi:2-amino-4-hydroxy-6-hydroxymethyldihydropteridine diphosphokinase
MAVIAVGLGGNLGNPAHTFNLALDLLSQEPQWHLQKVSSFYRTPAFGPPQPDYINACALFEVGGTPPMVLEVLQTVENQFGRVREIHWGPRTLDLDLLFYDQWVIDTADLTLPHPYMAERGSVLVPLAEIIPHWRHPQKQQTVLELKNQLELTGIELFRNCPPGPQGWGAGGA